MLIYTQLKDFLYLHLSIILTYILYINSEKKDILDYILHERVGVLNWFHIPVEMTNQNITWIIFILIHISSSEIY